MSGPRRRPGAAGVRFLCLPPDPEAAFRVRMLADRAEILALAEPIRGLGHGPRLTRCLARLEALAHGLAGASGVFGYPRLGAAAARLERLVERYRPAQTTLSPRRKALLAKRVGDLLGHIPAAPAATPPGRQPVPRRSGRT